MVKKSQFEILAQESLAELWDALTQDEKRSVTKNFAVHDFKKGQIIYAENDNPEYLYCLLSGKAKMYRTALAAVSKFCDFIAQRNTLAIVPTSPANHTFRAWLPSKHRRLA